MDIDNNAARRLPPPPPPPPPRPTATSTATGGTGVGEKATAEAGAAASMAAEQQRASVVANATALNEARGGAGQNLLGARSATTPPQPSSGTGDVGNVYRDAGAAPPSAPTTTTPTSPTPAASAQPSQPSTTTSPGSSPSSSLPRSGPGRTSAAAARAERLVHNMAGGSATQPATAGAAVAGSNDPRGAVRALAAQAGVPTPGVPMGRANLERRAQQISDDVQHGRTPTAAFGRPTEVSPAERQRLAQADPATRRQLGDEIGRREAQRDSLALAVGAGNVGKVEQAYTAATPDQRAQMAPQNERAAATANMVAVGQFVAGFVNPGARLAALSPAVRGIAQHYNRLAKLADLPTIPGVGAGRAPRPRMSGSSPSPSPRPARTEAQKERRRETDRLRQERQRMQNPV